MTYRVTCAQNGTELYRGTAPSAAKAAEHWDLSLGRVGTRFLRCRRQHADVAVYGDGQLLGYFVRIQT